MEMFDFRLQWFLLSVLHVSYGWMHELTNMRYVLSHQEIAILAISNSFGQSEELPKKLKRKIPDLSLHAGQLITFKKKS